MHRCTTHASTDPSYHSQNHRWIATNNRDVPRVMKTKFPATVLVFGVVSSEGHIMPPHIFEVSLKVNTKVYLDVLKSVVIPWCNQVVGGRPWLWQQDSAPVHKSKETQAWLQKECYDFVPFSHWRCPWCSRYRRRNWTRRLEFKSWTRLVAFHIALIPLGKVWIQLFSLQLWVNSRTD